MSRTITADSIGHFLDELKYDLIEDRKKERDQAEPIFYTLIDRYDVEANPDGDYDFITLYNADYGESWTAQALLEDALDEYRAPMIDKNDLFETLIDIHNGEDWINCGLTFTYEVDKDSNPDRNKPWGVQIKSEIDFLEYVIDNFCNPDAAHISYRKWVEHIVPDTLFLTRDAAERHLYDNYHHYTSWCHTYAMTAIRSPQVAELLRVLRMINFNKTKIALSKPENMVPETVVKKVLAKYITEQSEKHGVPFSATGEMDLATAIWTITGIAQDNSDVIIRKSRMYFNQTAINNAVYTFKKSYDCTAYDDFDIKTEIEKVYD